MNHDRMIQSNHLYCRSFYVIIPIVVVLFVNNIFVVSSFRVGNEPCVSYSMKQQHSRQQQIQIQKGTTTHLQAVSLNDNWDALTNKLTTTSSSGSSVNNNEIWNMKTNTMGMKFPTFDVPSLPSFTLPKMELPTFEIPNSVSLPAVPSMPSFQSSGGVQVPDFSLNFDTLNFGTFVSTWNTNELKSFVQNIVVLYNTLPLYAEVIIVSVPIMIVGIGSLIKLSYPDEEYRSNMEPYPRGEYDPFMARTYYSRHPIIVIQRLLQMLRLSNQFIIKILIDKYIIRSTNEVYIEKNNEKRANEVLELITKLGPTAIKVGQALSVRPDLINDTYAKKLATLQDQVPPFNNQRAQQIIQKELGLTKYKDIRVVNNYSKPIASASIGQVYKGTITAPANTFNINNQQIPIDSTDSGNNGMITMDVAVKVQRPNVLAEIALDLYLVREIIAPVYQKITKSSTDLQSLANEWGRGFIAELDYTKEADATIRFNNEMTKRQLNTICAPNVVVNYSSERILVTEWIDGTRLDESNGLFSDVPRLCSVALNAYLVMLLELKSLHCDPHPGNLLRTKDGRLCILDFGMTLDIENNLQYSLLEFVAHLTSEDYDQLPEDLAALGFLKKDKVEYVRRTGVLEPLKFFLRQAGGGGGANAVRDRIFTEYREKYPGLDDEALRVEMRSEMKQQMSDMVQRESVATGITVEVEDLQRRNRDSFQIPEWFLYSSRAFLTLEGVSLAADDNYSLIKSCFPYVAKRLVADDDPRARKALKDLLYGATDSVDPKRLADLADGFTSYTTTTKSINQQVKAHDGEIILLNGEVEKISKEADRRQKMLDTEATMTLAKDSADVLLASDGNLVQSLLVEESALAASANFKDIIRNQFVDGPKLFRESLPLGLGSFLPELPFESQVEPFVRKTQKEMKAQQLAEKISSMVQSQSSGPAGVNKKNDISIMNASNNNGNNEALSSVLETLRGMEPEQAALVLKEIRENAPRYAPLVGQLGGKFVSTLLNTASTNIEQTLLELETSGTVTDEAFKATVRGMSSAAQRGAEAITSSTAVASESNQR